MPTDNEDDNEPHPAINENLKDFISYRHDSILGPLHLANSSHSKFSADLEGYLSVLNGGGSIALSRGEDLASIRLSKSLETLFTTTTPHVRDGPPLTWTTVILFAGPHFEGPSMLKIGDSLVEVAEDDLQLLASGRPWRFLNPWPDKGDCEKEIQASEMALQELDDTRQIMQKGTQLISWPLPKYRITS